MHQFYETLFHHWGVRLRNRVANPESPVIVIDDENPELDTKMELHDMEMALKGIDVGDHEEYYACSDDAYMLGCSVDTPKGEKGALTSPKVEVIEVEDAHANSSMDLQTIDSKILELKFLDQIMGPNFVSWELIKIQKIMITFVSYLCIYAPFKPTPVLARMELEARRAARQALLPPKLEDVSPNIDTMETLPMDIDYKTPSPVVTKTNLFTPDKVDQIKKGLGDSFDTSMEKKPCEVQPIVPTGFNEERPTCLKDPYQMAEVVAAETKPGTGDVPAKPSLRRVGGLDQLAGESEATLETVHHLPPLPADPNHDGEHGGLHAEIPGKMDSTPGKGDDPIVDSPELEWEPEAPLEDLDGTPLPAGPNHDGEHGGLHAEIPGKMDSTPGEGDDPIDDSPELDWEPEAPLEDLDGTPLPADPNHDGEHGGLHAEIPGKVDSTPGKGDDPIVDSPELDWEPEAPLEDLDGTPLPADPNHDGEHGDLEAELDEQIENQDLDKVPVTSRVDQFANKKALAPKAKAKGKARAKAKAQGKAKAKGRAKAKAAALSNLGAKAKAKASSAKSRPRSRKQQPPAQHEALDDGIAEEQPPALEPLPVEPLPMEPIEISEPELPEPPAAPEGPRRGRKRRGDGDIKTFARRNMPKTFRSQSKWLAIRDSFGQHVRPQLTGPPSKFEDRRLTLLMFTPWLGF